MKVANKFKKPLKKPSEKSTLTDFIRLNNNASEFLDVLLGFEEFCISEDLLSFERETDLLFWKITSDHLQRIYKNQQNQNEDYLKILSAFSMIDDIKLKLYIIKNVIEETNPNVNNCPLFSSEYGFQKIFQITYVIIPFLKEFIKDNIDKRVHFKPTVEIDNELITTKESSQFKHLKKKLFRYYFLSEKSYYSFKEIENIRSSIKEVTITNLNVSSYSLLYSKIQKRRSTRASFREEAIKLINDNIIKFEPKYEQISSEFVDIITIEVAEKFMYYGQLLALTPLKHENSRYRFDGGTFSEFGMKELFEMSDLSLKSLD